MMLLLTAQPSCATCYRHKTFADRSTRQAARGGPHRMHAYAWALLGLLCWSRRRRRASSPSSWTCWHAADRSRTTVDGDGDGDGRSSIGSFSFFPRSRVPGLPPLCGPVLYACRACGHRYHAVCLSLRASVEHG
ncbi:hypothetical protein U9M48_022647 [Paspalum notatum var. saurae]|uniref:Uncharacterized protein n=1 Tax=Paspalum notatum var. saurae TaxID=547442 RepID=A0AAQ3TIN6_PASNO